MHHGNKYIYINGFSHWYSQYISSSWVISLLGDISLEWREAEGRDSRFCPKILREKLIYGSEELVHLETTKRWWGGSPNTEQGMDRAGSGSHHPWGSIFVLGSGIGIVWVQVQRFGLMEVWGQWEGCKSRKQKEELFNLRLCTSKACPWGFWASNTGFCKNTSGKDPSQGFTWLFILCWERMNCPLVFTVSLNKLGRKGHLKSSKNI